MGKDEFGRNRKFSQRGKEKQFNEIQEKDIVRATKRLNIDENEESDEDEKQKVIPVIKEEEEEEKKKDDDGFFNRK